MIKKILNKKERVDKGNPKVGYTKGIQSINLYTTFLKFPVSFQYGREKRNHDFRPLKSQHKPKSLNGQNQENRVKLKH